MGKINTNGVMFIHIWVFDQQMYYFWKFDSREYQKINYYCFEFNVRLAQTKFFLLKV